MSYTVGFRIDNVPDISGFRFRWKFLVGSDIFNPLSERKNFTGAYSQDNGKIICEVKLFDVYGKITDPADVTVEKEVYIQQGQDPADPRAIFKRPS